MSQYYICTYGCQMNELDSEIIAGQLETAGIEATDSEEKADVIVINTCSVRDSAERKVFGKLNLLSSLKLSRPWIVIAFCGCMAEEHKSSILKRYRYVDLVCGTAGYEALPEMIASAMSGKRGLINTGTDKELRLPYSGAKRTNPVKAFVSIMRGCDNYCSYCIVPYVRGREVSRPSAEILDEIKLLADNGYLEVTLLGQNVNSYGRGTDEKTDFPKLLELIHGIKGIERIRFVTSHPKDISDRLIQVMADLPKVCEYLHFPMQSGSDRILNLMNRGYTRSSYMNIVRKLNEKVAGISLSSDFIVGFPCETENDFNDTLSAVESIRYDNTFMFKYSIRKGTSAASLPDDVPNEVKAERHRRLLEVQNRISDEICKKLIGNQVEVLIEGRSRKNPARLGGRTRENRIAVLEGDDCLIGKFVRVVVEDANSHTLYCKLPHRK